MTQHEGKRHWDLAQGLIGEHGDVPCYDAVVRCDHERAAVHAALAQAHALAAIAASLEQFVHLFGLYESVPGEMGQLLTLAPEPEPVPATSPAETDLVFHGPDCPGHTTGTPGESCLAGYLEEPELTP